MVFTEFNLYTNFTQTMTKIMKLILLHNTLNVYYRLWLTPGRGGA